MFDWSQTALAGTGLTDQQKTFRGDGPLSAVG
jgi:hypothetical protein